MIRMAQPVCNMFKNEGLIGLRRIPSTSARVMWPPSNTGIGSMLSTARLMLMMTVNHSIGRAEGDLGNNCRFEWRAVFALHFQHQWRRPVLGNVMGQPARMEELNPIDFKNLIERPQTRSRRRAVSGYMGNDWSRGGPDQHFPQTFSLMPRLRLLDEPAIKSHLLPIPFDFKGDGIALAPDHPPLHARSQSKPFAHWLVIHFQNAIPRLQKTIRRRFFFHLTNDGGFGRFPFRPAHSPNDASEHHRQTKTQERASKGDNDFVPRGNGRQLFLRFVALAFDDLHRRHLRERDVASGGNAPQNIFDAVKLLFPDWLAEPDGEPLHFQSPPARGQEMAQLMHKNQQIKQRQHFEDDKDNF